MIITVIGSRLNKRAYIAERPDIKPQDCSTVYGAIGKLLYFNQKAFNLKVEVKDGTDLPRR